MIEHESTSSTDSWQKISIPYDEFDVLLTDINEQELIEIGKLFEVEHLSPGAFGLSPFPVTGMISGQNRRYMVPLLCQRGRRQTSKVLNVWFLIDTGSPFTALSKTTLEALYGKGNITHSSFLIAIQDQSTLVHCRISKDNFAEVNLLGADAMQQLNLSILVDWKRIELKLVRQ